MANAKSMEEKLGALIEYRKHLAAQFADRAISWQLQQLASDPMSDCIVMQIDGMDQGKFRLPRDPKLRATASVHSAKPKIAWALGVWYLAWAYDECFSMFF